jgi:hypothetical protein
MWFEPEKDGGVRVLKTEKFLKECPADKEYTICRKIYQNGNGADSFFFFARLHISTFRPL